MSPLTQDVLSIDGLQSLLDGEEPSAITVFDEDAAWPGDIDPEIVRRMLDDGPAKEAFLLVKVDGMTQTQAARQLGLSQPTVSRLIRAAWAEYRALHGLRRAPTDYDNGGPRVRSTFDLAWDGELRSDHYVEAGPVNGVTPPYSRSQLRRAQRKVRPLSPEAKRAYDRDLRIAERRYNPTAIGDGISKRGADPVGLGPDEELLRFSGRRWSSLCAECDAKEREFDERHGHRRDPDLPDKPQRREWPRRSTTRSPDPRVGVVYAVGETADFDDMPGES